MIGHLDEVVIDCRDTMRLAEFWQGVLGGTIQRQSREWVALYPPTGITVSFQEVPEHKAVKNRVHLDVRVDDLDCTGSRRVSAGRVPGGPATRR